jgi:hypothetical protein
MAMNARNRNEDRAERDLPVLVFDTSGGPWAFRNYGAAANWMEAIDVAAGEYEAYDSEGYVLSLSVVDDRVLIRRTSTRAYDQAVQRLRHAMLSSPLRLTTDTLEGMIRELF